MNDEYDIYALLDILNMEGFDVDHSTTMFGPRLSCILGDFLDGLPTYDEGFEDGTSEGRDQGFDIGYDSGYDSGYEDGFEEGRMEAKYGRDD